MHYINLTQKNFKQSQTEKNVCANWIEFMSISYFCWKTPSLNPVNTADAQMFFDLPRKNSLFASESFLL